MTNKIKTLNNYKTLSLRIKRLLITPGKKIYSGIIGKVLTKYGNLALKKYNKFSSRPPP